MTNQEAVRTATDMEKITRILNRAKAGLYMTVNEHKDTYEPIEKYISHLSAVNSTLIKDTGKDVIAKIIELDNIVEIQVYPDTPIGFYRVVHYDLDMALDKIIELIDRGDNFHTYAGGL